MIYVFDSSSFFDLNAFYPTVFPAVWKKLDAAVASGVLVSTREVLAEIEAGDADTVLNWTKKNKSIFATPAATETAFVAKILAVSHFQQMIGRKAQQRGTPVADPFVIACARVSKGTVVTEERLKPKAAKIPNVCDHFKIPWTILEGFMKAQGWKF